MVRFDGSCKIFKPFQQTKGCSGHCFIEQAGLGVGKRAAGLLLDPSSIAMEVADLGMQHEL